MDMQGIDKGDSLVVDKKTYIVDKVISQEASPVSKLMKQQKIAKELIVFLPSKEKFRRQHHRPERRQVMWLYENGKLSNLRKQTLAGVSAGRA